MDEVQTQDVQEEFVAPETEETFSEEQSNEAAKQEDDDREINFARLRRKAELAEMRAAELERKMQEYEASKKTPKDEFDDLDQIANDDLLTKEQSIKLARKYAREMIEESRRKEEQESLPDRLLSKFPDFESVVSVENVEQLKKLEPELAQALAVTKDPYAQAVAAYKYIKKFVPNAEYSEMEKNQAKKNMSKPGSPNQYGSQSAVHQANNFVQGKLTAEQKKKYFEEIMASKRSR